MTEFAKACAQSQDGILARLAFGLLNRDLFKAVDVSETISPGVVRFSDKAKEIIEGAGLPLDYSFENDTPSDTAYKGYNPDAEKPATQIYIEGRGGIHQELSECSESVKQLTRRYTFVRYYFPASVRERIVNEAVPLLEGR